MFDLLEVLQDADTIGISGHIRPDGDCVGSCMALYMYLTKLFPEKQIDVFLEPIPEAYHCIAKLEKVHTDFLSDIKTYDAFVVLDCENTRIGDAQPYFDKASKRINIDHHISNKGCGEYNYILPNASSTCEVLYDLLEEDKIDEEIALSLYLGIIHDCGVFQYSNTSPKTLEIAAKLISFGFHFSKIIEESFYQKTYLQNQLLGEALLNSRLLLDGRMITSYFDKDKLEQFGAVSSDLDGIVSQLRNTKGVDCAVFMYQMASGEYKVSMRSNEKVDVATIAKEFGGGGHVRAAGVTMSGQADDIVARLSERIREQLKLSQS